jgi:hypothetical protein
MSQAFTTTSPDGLHWGVRSTPAVPTLMGPWGQPVPVAAPYTSSAPSGEAAARAMLAQSMPLDMVQQVQACGPGGCPGMPGGMISPPGIPPGPGMPGGPVPPGLPPGLRPPGAVAAVGALVGPGVSPFGVQRSEVRFVGPAGMKISWYAPGADGKPGFGPQFLEAPARYNFLQASIYRLKLSDIPNRPGMDLYPTLEVVPAKAKTCTFLAHSAIPVCFTEEDFEQVAAGNFVVKVIYLPDPAFQDLAATCPDEVVSSRLEPGVDPICEAQRRGTILLIVRIGNIDLEARNTPAMDAPNPFCPPGGAPPGAPVMGGPPGALPNVPPGQAAEMAPGLPAPGPQAPIGAMHPGQMPPAMPPGLPTGRLPDVPGVQQTQANGTGGAGVPPAARPRTPAELAGSLTNWLKPKSDPGAP